MKTKINLLKKHHLKPWNIG